MVLVFLPLACFLVDLVARNRQHVFVNIDETHLVLVRNQGSGSISRRKQKRADGKRPHRDAVYRHHTRVTYVPARGLGSIACGSTGVSSKVKGISAKDQLG